MYNSSNSFIADLAYAIARNYYTHPISYDYAFGSINDIGIFGSNDHMNWKEFNEAIYQEVTFHVRKYCDDYVECFKNVYDRVFIDDEEIDFNALEFDLEKLSREEAIEEYDQFDDNNADSILDDIDISDIDDEILKDPVALCEWLEKHEI